MPLTLEEITRREEDLRREITEREHLLGAYEQMRTDLLGPSNADTPSEEHAEPAAVSFAPPAAPQLDPHLVALRSGHGGAGKVVSWAIRQMTEDYDLNDIAALLESQGCPLENASISVALTRMKIRGKIEQLAPGHGRTGALYRRPFAEPKG